MSGTSPWRGEHFANGRFFNPATQHQKFTDFLRWILHREMGEWSRFAALEPGPPPPERVEGSELRVTFVNHSTFLLQTAGQNLLTDPVWSERVSPVSFAGPKRRRAPGLRIEDLPRIDAILLSHNHYDHFDKATLTRLLRRDHPVVFCPLGLAEPLRKLGFVEICELDWWQQVAWCGLRVHCVPAQHFSARGPFDRNRTLWCGWMLDGDAGSIYFAGDTGFGSLFEEIAASFPRIRLSLLPIGAYKPHWFMGPIHMAPSQALYAHRILRSAFTIATHFGTFPLADDGEKEPLEWLERAMRQDPPAGPFIVLKEGEGRDIPGVTEEDSAVLSVLAGQPPGSSAQYADTP
jgi:L-ascorbate metabolism protein UlaG (beta-lactamase superfamily)